MKYPILLFLLAINTVLLSQEIDLGYYLPDSEYNSEITTPKEFLGWEVGEWHVSHDKLYYYMKTLAEESDRITLTEYARSHEKRPLIYLTITSPENQNRIEEIREEHLRLTDTNLSEDVDISDMPIIVYQGCSIHGNEPSGANGALAAVYYLAAAKGKRIEKLLNDAVILFDPSYNPDGLNRFASWVNSHKGKNLIADSNSREYSEAWPRGRTNHYWFDLNRDWLLLTHPESQGRIKAFHQWKPDILTDHHEMGTNSTFFFQPGIESRNNPNTPKKNTELTYEIAKFHGRALDKIGSLYYTKESFDDFYYGKGSTYPDAQGSIGILFEQASSRGHLQESDNGLITFPFTIRNQVTTMFSTQDAAVALREQILEYKRQSFLNARKLADKNKVKGYAFGDPHDAVKVNRFIEILLSHQIEVHQLDQELEINSTSIGKNNGYYVSLDQDQYRLAKSIFERVSTFQDSLFYDVSAWTLPLAFDIPYTEVEGKINVGTQLKELPSLTRRVNSSDNPYAYLIEWNSYYAPRALKTLLKNGVIVKLANEAFTTGQLYNRGTLIIPTGNNQTHSQTELRELMEKISMENQVNITGVGSGLVESGVNLGSRSLSNIEDPEAMILIGNGVNSYDAGEIWHHFDQRLELAVPMIDIDHLSRVNLKKYRTIIMPDGSYNGLNKHTEDIKEWIREGGNIVAIKGALQWLKNQEIISLEYQTGDKEKTKKEDDKSNSIPSYADANEERGSKITGGMIAKTDIDITHPLFYGYHRSTLPVFKKGNSFYKPVGGKYSTPARYSQSPHLSGYIHKDNLAKMPKSTAVFTSKMGKGNIIGLVDNPVFRGYWWGSSKLFANAVFFGQTL
ncbi:MAG: hypothetical protein ACJA01_001717 [Saprospiraceae bacterium]|jgi:hypothetical protein